MDMNHVLGENLVGASRLYRIDLHYRSGGLVSYQGPPSGQHGYCFAPIRPGFCGTFWLMFHNHQNAGNRLGENALTSGYCF